MHWVTAIGWWVSLLWLTGAGTSSAVAGSLQTPAPVVPEPSSRLEILADRPVERELKGGECHRYSLTLSPNSFLHLQVEQKGIDLALILVGPDGKELRKENNWYNGPVGPEQLLLLATETGQYRLEVQSTNKEAPAGTYELRVKALRTATPEDKALVELEELAQKAEDLLDQGKTAQAAAPIREILDRAAKVFGQEHQLYAKGLNLLGLYWQQARDLPKAEANLTEALTLREKIFGPNHLMVAVSLVDLAMLRQAQNDFAPAETGFKRAIAIREGILGKDNPSVAYLSTLLGEVYYAKGDYRKAEATFLQALEIFNRNYPGERAEKTRALNDVAFTFQIQGDFDKALRSFETVLKINEKNLSPDAPQMAQSLNNLGWLYQTLGEYTQAGPLLERSLKIREKEYGPDHLQVAHSLNSLATLFKDQGDYIKAEAYYQRVVAIREKNLGPNHPEVAAAISYLALLYQLKGDLESAEPLFLRSLEISEKTLGSEHPDVANSVQNLGELYRLKGDLEKAEPLLIQSLRMKEKQLGADHQFIPYTLISLGLLYQVRRDWEKADAAFTRALTIWEKRLDKNHPLLSNCLIHLAGLARKRKKPEQAESYLLRATNIYRTSFSEQHPYLVNTNSHLAQISLLKGNPAQALEFQTHSNEICETNLVRNLAAGSERQKLLYLKSSGDYTDLTISLHVQHAPASQSAATAAATIVLRRKGRALDAMSRSIETLRRHASPEEKQWLDELAAAKGSLSSLLLKGPGREGAVKHQENLRALNGRIDRLEALIGSRSAQFQAQNQPITLEAVQHAIPSDAALVEFMTYRPYEPKQDEFGPARYVAYVLGRDFPVRWVDLGPTAEIDPLLEAFRGELLGGQPARNLTRIEGENQPQQSLKRARQAGQDLYRKLMKPVLALTGPHQHLLLSPDGNLNLVPFAALVDDQGKFLVQQFSMTYLSSGRDLLRFQFKAASGKNFVVLADPDYEKGPGPALFGAQSSPLLRLLGTHQEGVKISEIFPETQLKMESNATEAVLKQVDAPIVLHIATHGFFLPAEKAPTTTTAQPVLKTDGQRSFLLTDVTEIRKTNPLLRSGLFLAGANTGKSGTGEDGTLTALEATGLNLWGTELVTLSACETGLGDVLSGEGVYGLRRAFWLAGSESLVMSLWKVSDKATRDLMVAYYKRLKAGEDRGEALRQVQLEMLARPKTRHPYFWAGFFQSGNWQALPAKP
ncbi:MAG: CHAT domain-containing protein [Blastocatellia bacterium]|nr:CHAT domain-containing protein [Blastocatellia bacterium]